MSFRSTLSSGPCRASTPQKTTVVEQLRQGLLCPTLSAEGSRTLRSARLTYGELVAVLSQEGSSLGLSQDDVDELLWLISGEDFLDVESTVPWEIRQEILRLFPLTKLEPLPRDTVRTVPRLNLRSTTPRGPRRSYNPFPPVEVDSYRERDYYLIEGKRQIEDMIDVSTKDDVKARSLKLALRRVPPLKVPDLVLEGGYTSPSLASSHPSRRSSYRSTPGLYVPIDSFSAIKKGARTDRVTSGSHDVDEDVPEAGRNIVRVDALSHDASKDDVKALFDSSGYDVKRVILLHALHTRKYITSGGHAVAFVTLKDESQATAASRQLCGRTICWRPVKVSLSSFVELLCALERREVQVRELTQKRATTLSASETLHAQAMARIKATPLPPTARPISRAIFRRRKGSIGPGGATPDRFLAQYIEAEDAISTVYALKRGDRPSLK